MYSLCNTEWGQIFWHQFAMIIVFNVTMLKLLYICLSLSINELSKQKNVTMSLTEPTFFHYFSFYKISLIITVIYQSISPKFPKFICYCLNTNQRHSAHNSLFLIKKKTTFFTLIVYSYNKCIFLNSIYM